MKTTVLISAHCTVLDCATTNTDHFQRIIPSADFLSQCQLAIERHDVVQVVARIPVLAARITEQAFQPELSHPGLGQGHLAGKINPVEAGRLIRVLPDAGKLLVDGLGT